MKHNKIIKYLDIAKSVSTLSPDAETKVGSIIVKDGIIVGTGYNGFLRNSIDFYLPKTRPQKYQYIIHSEINAILNCARIGVSLMDCDVYLTLSPCVNCCRALFQSGINTIYFSNVHESFKYTLNSIDFDVTLLVNDEYCILKRLL